ncbi:MAG: LPS-assembly protein LptD [Alphaproteobacteria bacterium]
MRSDDSAAAPPSPAAPGGRARPTLPPLVRFAALLLVGAALGLALAAPAAQAQWVPVAEGGREILLVADEVAQDDDVVTARGSVEVERGGRLMLADSVSWNRSTGIVSAAGNVALVEPDGTVVFAETVEITEDLRDGVIDELRMLLSDDSRLAARSARRTAGQRTVMRRAVYSPCALCETDRTRPPLWQIKAREVVHDEVQQEIVYKDAIMEMWGVPVMYAPYFFHPDPTVERKTGLLAPTFGSDSDLGLFVRQPFHIAIAPNQDATLTPIFLSKEGVIGAGEYRYLWNRGRLGLRGSAGQIDRTVSDGAGTRVKRNEWRGHLRANGAYDIDENWRARAQIYRASDDTYLRKLDFDDAPTLRSEAFVEYFSGRSWGTFGASTVQELRDDVANRVTPSTLPHATFSYVGRQGPDGYWSANANAAVFIRDEGTESRRLSLSGGWNLPVPTEGGYLFDLSVGVRGDVYSVDDVVVNGRSESGVVGRLVPQAVASWRYPLARITESMTQVIEPVAMVAVAPNRVNPRRIPNEDSSNLDFDDLNLMEANRFPGYDRVEGGQRLTYGLRAGAHGLEGGRVEAFVGQSLRHGADDFDRGSGLRDGFSDVVGRLQVSPADWLDMLYRFRVDKDDLSFRRSEFALRAGTPRIRVSAEYVQLDSATATTDLFSRREQVRIGVQARLTENWSAFGSHRRDLEANDPLRTQVGLLYEDECFAFQATYTRDYTSDRDLRQDEKIMFRVHFKQLGSLSFGESFGGGSRDQER